MCAIAADPKFCERSACIAAGRWRDAAAPSTRITKGEHLIRDLIRENTALRRLYYRTRLLRPASESDERQILANLTKGAPKTFVEFGFHPIEFNCVDFAKDPEWSGLLIDGSRRQVDDARALWPSRIEFVERFLTLDNLDFIRKRFAQLGILSIDVDGNDYWFLKALIDLSPAVISVEYNSTLGFEPITVPYDPSFDRHEKHPLGWYHGASITALTRLCEQHGYGLAAGSDGSCNAFFTRDGKRKPEEVWRPKKMREQRSGMSTERQWEEIKHLPFVTV